MFLFEAIFTALLFAVTAVMVVRVFQRRAAIAIWEGSVEGARQRRALASWVRADAEVIDVGHGDGPRVTEVRHGGRYEEIPRASVRLELEIATTDGPVIAKDTITVPVSELVQIDVGKTIRVLYDPEDPKSFHVDTLA